MLPWGLMGSDVLALLDGTVDLPSACVVDVLRLKEHDPNLFGGHGFVLNSLGDHDDFSRAHQYSAVAEFHGQLSFDDLKKFVLLIVAVPNKFTLDFGQLHILAIELGNDFWGPLLLKQSKFFFDGNRLHDGKVKTASERVGQYLGAVSRNCTYRCP